MKLKADDTTKTEPHVKSSPLYVSAVLRICLGCAEGKNVHPLARFTKSIESGQYSVLCRDCQKQDEAFENMNVDERAVRVVEDLNTTLKRVAKKSGSKEQVIELLDEFYKPFSGGANSKTAFHKVGQMFGKVLDRGLADQANFKEVELAAKVGDSVIKNAVAAEKRAGPQIDLSELTEEEMFDILLEPARQYILDNEKFRKHLLSDDKVRRLLLSESGISVVDMATSTAGGVE